MDALSPDVPNRLDRYYIDAERVDQQHIPAPG